MVPNFINGQWTRPEAKTLPIFNPATGETIDEVPLPPRSEVDRRDHAVLLLAAQTGLRQSELTGPALAMFISAPALTFAATGRGALRLRRGPRVGRYRASDALLAFLAGR